MQKVLIVLAGVLVMLVSVVALLFWLVQSTVDVALEAAKGLINLAVAVAVTGMLTFVLAQRSQSQSRREDKLRVLTAALQELKGGFERASVGRYLIAAHPTGQRLAAEIDRLGEARARLHRVQRERFLLDTEVDQLVDAMVSYLAAIAREYRDNYPAIFRSQACEEALYEQARRGEEFDLKQAYLIPAPEFPGLAAYLDDAQWNSSVFVENYDKAKAILQRWIAESST